MTTTTRYLIISELNEKIAKIKKKLAKANCDFYETRDLLTLYEDALNEIEEGAA